MLIDDIRTYLMSLGIGNGDGFIIYEGYMPDDQDDIIGLFETGGLGSWTLQGENERPTFMTRVRGSRLQYGVLHTKWRQIYTALQDSQPNSNYYLVKSMQDGPLAFYDDMGRMNMTTNWRTIRSREF